MPPLELASRCCEQEAFPQRKVAGTEHGAGGRAGPGSSRGGRCPPGDAGRMWITSGRADCPRRRLSGELSHSKGGQLGSSGPLWTRTAEECYSAGRRPRSGVPGTCADAEHPAPVPAQRSRSGPVRTPRRTFQQDDILNFCLVILLCFDAKP